VEDLERLIKLVVAQFRWGVHPLKMAIALLLPVLIVWLADRRIRRLSSAAAGQDGPRRDVEPAGSVLRD